MKDRTLLEVTEVIDDSTGIWHIGEIEFGIYGGLVDEYLKKYGEKGRNAITQALNYLEGEVERRYKKFERNLSGES